jgi:hypothetical protein
MPQRISFGNTGIIYESRFRLVINVLGEENNLKKENFYVFSHNANIVP